MLLLNFVELSIYLLEVSYLKFFEPCNISLAPCCWGIAVANCGSLVAVGRLLRSCSGSRLLRLGCHVS